MHPQCTHCGLSFVREPGFYFGAMYMSYALYTALTVAILVLFVAILDLSAELYFAVMVPLFVVLMPVFFRWGRLLWINLFVGPNSKDGW